MGELAEDFQIMKEERAKRRANLEPKRAKFVMDKLMEIGCEVTYNDFEKAVHFSYKNIKGKIYPYKGWYSAKGIGSDRGIKKLIKKLKKV